MRIAGGYVEYYQIMDNNSRAQRTRIARGNMGLTARNSSCLRIRDMMPGRLAYVCLFLVLYCAVHRVSVVDVFCVTRQEKSVYESHVIQLLSLN